MCVCVCVCWGVGGTLRSPSWAELLLLGSQGTDHPVPGPEEEQAWSGRWNRRGPTAHHSVLHIEDLAKDCSASQLSTLFFLDLKSSTQMDCPVTLAIKIYTHKADFLNQKQMLREEDIMACREQQSQLLSLSPGTHSKTSTTPHLANLRTENQRARALAGVVGGR